MNQEFNPYTNPQNNENQYNQNLYPPPPFQPPKPINFFEKFSLIFGVGAILSCMVFYLSYMFGALAIVFVLLSRGSEMKMSPKAKLALFLGIAAIVLSTTLTIGALIFAIEEFGSIEAMLQEYCNMYGLDFEELYGDSF